MSSDRPVVLTCAQPTNTLTLGNYLGALGQWARMINNCDCYFGLVDLHAITADYNPADLRKNTFDCAAQYIACGLNPEKSHLFVQSHVTGHTELAWVLGSLTPIGELQRMTQFKEKAAKLGFQSTEDSENELKFTHDGARAQASVNSGLLYYPVLMASDILLYNADVVPTGEDQKQHLELCRDLARRFNHRYSDTFTIPEPRIAKEGARIMSLQEPTKKMSKSDSDALATVFITDEPKLIQKKIMSAVTDSGSDVRAAPDKPGITNLMTILSVCSKQSMESIETEFASKGYGEFKKSVAEAVIATLDPIQTKYHEFHADKTYIQQVLKKGAETAQKRAYKTLAKVYRKTGFMERVR
ncbi:MAG: tryptophan--tRNA ligase [Opitutales bacterium]|nr:tryptophan--tRNA ligase [Opitutales bacterium]NRA26220.1 tryptophan--tRNA ligase [Opitutales bacterium]